MPPFGNLYGLPVFADRSLAEKETIVFQAGTHTETLASRWSLRRRPGPPRPDLWVRIGLRALETLRSAGTHLEG